ncbi:MAG TPA: hypothetical protein VHO90_01655 [Bacteroidales bacterium]|nr:hypothetical protein [Bacteroidales bacterium]
MTGKFSLFLLLLFVAIRAESQHLIGLSRTEVEKKLQEKGFALDNTSKNTTFNYDKYVDALEEKTLLAFFTKNDVCSSVKLMCDYSSYKETLNEFNKKYKKTGPNEWNYVNAGITYKVVLKKEDWFYSVIVTTKTK